MRRIIFILSLYQHSYFRQIRIDIAVLIQPGNDFHPFAVMCLSCKNHCIFRRIFIIEFSENVFFLNDWFNPVHVFQFMMIENPFRKFFSWNCLSGRSHRMDAILRPCFGISATERTAIRHEVNFPPVGKIDFLMGKFLEKPFCSVRSSGLQGSRTLSRWISRYGRMVRAGALRPSIRASITSATAPASAG